MKFFTIPLAILISLPAIASTKAWFADRCSGEEISISTPNPVTFYLSLKDLDPSEDIQIFIKYRPAGIIEDLRDKKLEVSYTYSIPSSRIKGNRYSGYFKIPSATWMWQKEQEHNLTRIWDAEVKWTQPKSRKLGGAIASFFRARGEKEFYKVESPSLCYWEGDPEVSSKLYENNTSALMNVMKSTYDSWDKYTQRGLTFGYNRNHGGNVPLGSSSDSYGWFYKDWQKQVESRDIISIDRKFILQKDEAGVFYTRNTFHRVRASKWEWNPRSGACGRYEQTAEGMLDVGVTSEDFVVLPRTYYSFPEKTKEFINIVRPPINTCDDYIHINPQYATDSFPSGFNGIMFFYENF